MLSADARYCPVYRREKIGTGTEISGPAVIGVDPIATGTWRRRRDRG